MLDYHVHTRYCRHAVGEVIDYVKAAVRKGLNGVGFADHYPMFYLPLPSYDDYSMSLDELPAYIRDIEEAKKRFEGRVEVKVGVEVDYYRSKVSLLKRMLSSQEFDYMIGVIHLLDDWVIDDTRSIQKYEEYDLDTLYSRYFEELKVLIRSRLFDIVGHLDVIKRFNFIPEGGVEQYLLPLLDSIAERDMCVEVNTSGLDRPVKDTYPGIKLFKRMYERGVQVTIGSDAHSPEEVGRHFKKVLQSLKKSGYSKIASFNKRERILEDI